MLQKFLTETAINHPRKVIIITSLITLLFLIAFPNLKTDTDPVHMLAQDNQAVVLHKKIKKNFNIHDYIAIGIEHKNGKSLFTVDGLTKIYNITKEISEIKNEKKSENFLINIINKLKFIDDNDKNLNQKEIIVKEDIIAISTVDDIIKNNKGELLVSPLMSAPPKTEKEAYKILEKINDNPILGGKINAKDGSLIGIFVPLKEGMKEKSYYLGEKMKSIAQKYIGPNEKIYLGGLPIAESTFGSEMFLQMGVYAPLAGIVIFLLMLFFFRNPTIVMAPMILGVYVVIWSMGALIYSGNTVHIMSSMIPIFILPIAVLDSIHIMSKLSDKLPLFNKREDAIREVMKELFNPMLYTSLTTMVGFISLSTTGIPPVVVFGITVGFGVFMSWILSVIFIPSITMLMKEKSLQSFANHSKKSSIIEIVRKLGLFSKKYPISIIVTSICLLIISFIGINQIIVNDNPVRWFKSNHFLRKADKALNRKIAGTYLTNLYFSIPDLEKKSTSKESTNEFDEFDEFDEFENDSDKMVFLPSIKDPEIISYIDQISDFLKNSQDKNGNKLVGDVTSIVDVLKKVGKTSIGDNSLPKTREQTAQYMFLFESGDPKKGKDMWKLITPGESLEAQMWVYFKNGDNQNMIKTMKSLNDFMKKNPPPVIITDEGQKAPLSVNWSGLVYINNVWQAEMVKGMMWALMGSFFIVTCMMIFLFRRISLGIIAMFPLSLTISFIYGFIGFSGKYYDMPIAVLSSLTLGLSVDFAIHFIESIRFYTKKYNNYPQAYDEMFNGTAQAIWRNVLVISIGFIPLFFAGLVPYITVGAFFFAIMLVSGVTTLVLMPAIFNKLHSKILS